jgi:glycosyltransferase involved in cell wall biosynthesis
MTDPLFLIAAHAWYGDLIGGSFRLATEFAEFLASRGHRVAYVCCAAAEKGAGTFCRNGPEGAALPFPLPYCDEAGVRVYRYPARRPGSFCPPVLYHVLHTRRLVRRLTREFPVTAISGHSPLQFLGACLGARGTGAFRNYTVHSPFDDELLADSARRGQWSSRFAAAVARWIDGRNIRLADRVQTDSHYTLDSLHRKHGRRVLDRGVVSPGWVDLDAFQPADDRAVARAALGGPWQFDGPLFFTLRRLESRMGLDTLIDAADRLRQQNARFRVLIGGGGPLAATLAAMIHDRGLGEHVVLLGRIEQDRLGACYAAADCFVLPTRALECFGLIVLEAYAAGTPVIASDVAAIPELVRQTSDAWLFPPGDDQQLANRMAAFLDGQLQPEHDVRTIAQRYEKEKVLTEWERLARGERGEVRGERGEVRGER